MILIKRLRLRLLCDVTDNIGAGSSASFLLYDLF